MEEKPLILLGSARKNSDTGKLVSALFADTEIRLADLLDYRISPYSYEGRYPDDDSFQELVQLMLLHQVVVFATPVYWYAMSGHMKNFFDRLTDLVTTHKKLGRQLEGKSTFLVAVGAETALPDGFEIPFQLTSAYFKMTFMASYYHKTGREYVKDSQETAFLELVTGSSQTG